MFQFFPSRREEKVGVHEHDSLGALNLSGNRPTRRQRSRSTSDRIAQLEAELDTALATESDPARRTKLVNDHNATLQQLNLTSAIADRRSDECERRGRAVDVRRHAEPSRSAQSVTLHETRCELAKVRLVPPHELGIGVS